MYYIYTCIAIGKSLSSLAKAMLVWSPRLSSNAVKMQLHSISDASEHAYAGVVYLRMVDTEGNVHLSLMSKTRVAPIKRQTIPRLELCGAHLLAQLLHHTQEVFHISPCNIYA